MSQTDAWPWTCARINAFIHGRTKFELDIVTGWEACCQVDDKVGDLRFTLKGCLDGGLDDHIEDAVWEAVLIDD